MVANRPVLAVTYNSVPSAPVVTSPNGGETWNASQTVTWTASTDVSNLSTLITTSATALVVSNKAGVLGQTLKAPTTGWVKSISLFLGGNGTAYTRTMRLSDGNPAGTGTVYSSGSITVPATQALVAFTLPTQEHYFFTIAATITVKFLADITT